MNHRLFAAVEARIDRGVTQAKARAAAQQMADRATRTKSENLQLILIKIIIMHFKK